MTRNNPTGAAKNGPRRRTTKPDLEALAQLSGRISALEPQQADPNRRSVYIDGEYVLGLHAETIVLAKLKVGMVVDGARLVAVLRQDEAKRAWDAALLLLGTSARSRREVEQRLARRFDAEIVASVVERLAGGGWLDDAEFARSYVRSHPDYGERRLMQALTRKGVARAVAGQVISELLANVDETANARAAAEARLRRMNGVDRDTAQRRLVGYLARRGYGFETIQGVLGPLLKDLPRAPRPERSTGGLRRSRWARQEEDA